MPSDRPPPQLGNYQLLMLLAAGGMANVYAARQLGAAGFQRMVVIKRVHAHLLEDQEFYDMFRDEATLASLVRHPNVVPVTDVIEAEGELFLVMDYVDGVALSTVLKTAKARQDRLPPRAAVRIVADALAGLHAAHEVVDMKGHHLELVHRDVSPHNILVGADGISRLIDFGVAKAVHRSTQTRSGALKGKYPYMSPEHARGLAVDRRSDIFAAAAVLHEVLTGKRLFQGTNDLDTLRRVMEAPVPLVSDLIAGLPRSLDAVLAQALSRDVEHRFQTAQDFIDALEHALAPAPHREVRGALSFFCEDRMVERRNYLQAMLDGRLQPLSIRQPRAADDASGSQRAAGRGSGSPPPSPYASARLPISGSGPSGAVSGPSGARMAPPPVPSALEVTTVEGMGEGTKATQITHDAPILRPTGGGRSWKAAAGLLGAAAVGVAVAWVLLAPVPTERATSASPSQEVASAAPQPAASGQPDPQAASAMRDEIEILVVADAPIESVRAPGARDAAIDGAKARLRVARWKGTLPIDAVLAGGGLAHAVALEGAVGEVHLDPVSADAGTPARASPRRPSPPPPPQPDLHANPYGP